MNEQELKDAQALLMRFQADADQDDITEACGMLLEYIHWELVELGATIDEQALDDDLDEDVYDNEEFTPSSFPGLIGPGDVIVIAPSGELIDGQDLLS